jgi:hypothetical protein
MESVSLVNARIEIEVSRRRGNKKWVLPRKEGESTLQYMWVGSVGRLCGWWVVCG